jgi:ribonuclease BN (tRNA processing enzyme)
MRLTILGSGLAWANPGGSCSGYLLMTADASLMLECGPGTLGRLRAACDPAGLDAVIISHLHSDHLLDLVPFRYGAKYGGLTGDRRLRVLVPPGGIDFLARLGDALDGGDFFTSVFDVSEYDPTTPLTFGGTTVRFDRVQHYIPSYAMRIEAGRTLTYSADSAPCDALVEHARGSDVFLCEAACRTTADDQPNPAERGHLTAEEAGAIAARAQVGRLLLTHAPLDPSDPDASARAARTTFDGPVERVVDGRCYRL